MTSISKSQNHSASEALGLWEPKRTLTLAAARRHSARIRFLRRLLIGLTILLGAFVVWTYSQRGTEIAKGLDETESARMVNPRFSGRTADGLPYKLTADEAIRLSHSASEVELVKPVMEFFREAGAETSIVIAEEGTYDDVTQVLNLRTDVDLTTDDGNKCLTSHARIFTLQQRIEGDEPIRCNGTFGVITGQTYEILDNYAVFKFKDGMTALLEDESSDDETSDATEQSATENTP